MKIKRIIFFLFCLLILCSCSDNKVLRNEMVRYCKKMYPEINAVHFCGCIVDEKLSGINKKEKEKAERDINIKLAAKQLFEKYKANDGEYFYKCFRKKIK